MLSTTSTTFGTAYGTTMGWDFATGIGTVNAANLVNAWNTSNITLSGGGTVAPSGQLSYHWVIGNTGPRTATTVVLSTTLPAGFSLASGSSSACTATGQVVQCTIATIALGGSSSLTIVIQPTNASIANLTFTVTSSNGVLFPVNDSVTTSLNIPQTAETDAPLPLWALGALAAGVVGIASRRLKGGAR